MARVIFETNIKADVKNLIGSVAATNRGGRDFSKDIDPKIIKIVKSNSKKKAFDLVMKRTSKFYKKNHKLIKLTLKQFEDTWKLIEKDYFKRLAKVTKKPICSQKFTACLTTAGRCPYWPEKFWFMVSLLGSPLQACRLIAHEILHMQILYYYKDKLPYFEKHPSKAKLAWALIESLTILLNEEFSDILFFKDNGYPDHQKLRARLSVEWRKTRDFDKFLPKAIEITKRMMK